MKTGYILVVVGAALLAFPLVAGAAGLKVAVVTGGHDFAEKPFLSVFEGYTDIAPTHIVLQDDSEMLEDISQWPYDVLVLYNLTQRISEKRQQNLVALLDRGVGLVVLHHAIADYSDWPEYAKIIGVKYYLKDTVENGVTHPRCVYEDNVDMKIHVEDAAHPVVQGLNDFPAKEETYKGSTFAPDNHLLLSTDNPKNDKGIAWTRTYKKANVCYIQLGHGAAIFSDPNYRQLVVQAIRWSAKK